MCFLNINFNWLLSYVCLWYLCSLFLGGDVDHEIEDDKPRKSQKDDEEQIAKYRELLQSIQEKEKKQEEKDIGMEIKWVPGKLHFFSSTNLQDMKY